MDPSFGWEYVGPVVSGLRGDTREAILAELHALAQNSTDTLVAVGAYSLLGEASTVNDEPRFIELLDVTLDYLKSKGYSSGQLSRFEADRWIARHGDLRSSFDSIVEVEVPKAAGELPDVQVGDSLLLALTGPLPEGNAFYAERQQDSEYVVFSERTRSSDDPSRVRCDESYLGIFDSMHDLCKAIGKMLGTRPYWAHDAMEPYFPAHRS